MATRHNNTVFLLLAVGVGGYLLYKNGAFGATTTTTTPVLPPASHDTAGGAADQTPTSPPITSIISPIQTVSPITATAGLTQTANVTKDGSPLPPGITQDMYNTVMTWAYADGRAPVKAMATALVPTEYAGMYDIIKNQWGKNAQATSAQETFWNNLRTKYDPQHKVW